MTVSVFTKTLAELRLISKGEPITAQLFNEPRKAINTLLRGVTPPQQVQVPAQPAAGGAISFCVVRNIEPVAGSDRIISIALVKVADGGALTFDGDVVNAHPWPPLRSRHYRAFLWNGNTIEDETNVLPAMQIGGVWWVQQQLTWGELDLQSSLPISDCQV